MNPHRNTELFKVEYCQLNLNMVLDVIELLRHVRPYGHEGKMVARLIIFEQCYIESLQICPENIDAKGAICTLEELEAWAHGAYMPEGPAH